MDMLKSVVLVELIGQENTEIREGIGVLKSLVFQRVEENVLR